MKRIKGKAADALFFPFPPLLLLVPSGRVVYATRFFYITSVENALYLTPDVELTQLGLPSLICQIGILRCYIIVAKCIDRFRAMPFTTIQISSIKYA